MLSWLNFACKPLAVLAGSLFPSYLSYRALESTEGSEERNVMLSYWVIFGVLNVLEVLLSVVWARIPLFQLGKLCFVIWLQAPQTQGAQKLYRRHFLPLLKQHQARIDQYLEEGRRQLGEQFQWASSTVTAARAGSGEGLAPRSSNAARSE